MYVCACVHASGNVRTPVNMRACMRLCVCMLISAYLLCMCVCISFVCVCVCVCVCLCIIFALLSCNVCTHNIRFIFDILLTAVSLPHNLWRCACNIIIYRDVSSTAVFILCLLLYFLQYTCTIVNIFQEMYYLCNLTSLSPIWYLVCIVYHDTIPLLNIQCSSNPFNLIPIR
jgi:hypothetical protein